MLNVRLLEMSLYNFSETRLEKITGGKRNPKILKTRLSFLPSFLHLHNRLSPLVSLL